MSPSSSEKPVAIVTGASAGIGEGVVHRFAKGGFRIVAVARGQAALDKLSKDVSKLTDIVTVATDVAAKDAADRAVNAATKNFGRLDALVNNAGLFKFGTVADTDDEMLDQVIDISLKGPFRFSRAALGVMKPGSSITCIGSVWGILAGMQGGSYCAVKAGLIGLTQSIAADFGPKGIRANLVAPGVVRTGMTDAFWDTDFFHRTNHELTPFNRECTVADVANLCYFLASPEGSYINGQTIALDGGWSATKYLAADAVMAERAPPKKASA